jgi:hypothetical protein
VVLDLVLLPREREGTLVLLTAVAFTVGLVAVVAVVVTARQRRRRHLTYSPQPMGGAR